MQFEEEDRAAEQKAREAAKVAAKQQVLAVSFIFLPLCSPSHIPCPCFFSVTLFLSLFLSLSLSLLLSSPSPHMYVNCVQQDANVQGIDDFLELSFKEDPEIIKLTPIAAEVLLPYEEYVKT